MFYHTVQAMSNTYARTASTVTVSKNLWFKHLTFTQNIYTTHLNADYLITITGIMKKMKMWSLQFTFTFMQKDTNNQKDNKP